MADKTLMEILQGIFAHYGSPDEINQDEFWEGLCDEKKIDAPTRDLFKQLSISEKQKAAFLQLGKEQRDAFLRSGKQPQVAFFEDLHELVLLKEDQPNNIPQRRNLYQRLARYYDCVFKFVEESEPGSTGDVNP